MSHVRSLLINCEHPDRDLVWVPISNGRRQLRYQCAACGELVGPAVSQVQAKPDTPNVNLEALSQSRLRWQQQNALADQVRDAVRVEW